MNRTAEQRAEISRGCRRSARSVAARRVYFDALAALGSVYPQALADPIRPAAIARALRLLAAHVLPGSPAHRAIRHVLDYRSPRAMEMFFRRTPSFISTVRVALQAPKTTPPETAANSSGGNFDTTQRDPRRAQDNANRDDTASH